MTSGAEAGHVARRWVIEGKVQGVGFRHFARAAANELVLRGTVRNRADGTVEILVSGPNAAVSSFRARVAAGPSWAEVVGIAETELDDARLPSPFEVCF